VKELKIEVGRLVKSLKGHDAGNIYMIIKQEDDFVWLSDGDYKKLDKPKKKRIKHVEPLEKVSFTIAGKTLDNKLIHNQEIYSRIKQYKEIQKKEGEKNG
jgi:ribosomal protein L14E/L6E/L27E